MQQRKLTLKNVCALIALQVATAVTGTLLLGPLSNLGLLIALLLPIAGWYGYLCGKQKADAEKSSF